MGSRAAQPFLHHRASDLPPLKLGNGLLHGCSTLGGEVNVRQYDVAVHIQVVDSDGWLFLPRTRFCRIQITARLRHAARIQARQSQPQHDGLLRGGTLRLRFSSILPRLLRAHNSRVPVARGRLHLRARAVAPRHLAPAVGFGSLAWVPVI